MFESMNEQKQHYAGCADGRSHQPVYCFTHPHAMNTVCNTETATLGSSNKVMDPYSVEYENINDSFPFKLHIMLGEIEEQGLGGVVSWQPHGRCFVVRNRQLFVQDVMPTFFRMSKYESFQRQLNLYGFNRITAGRDKGGYYHESFVRARRDLCFEIQRHKVKGTFVRKPATRENEPNFYKLPPSVPEHGTKSNPSSPPPAPISTLQVPQNVYAASDMRSGQPASSVTLGQSLVSVMAPQVVDTNMMMQSLMNLSPCLAATMATMYTGGMCQRGDEGRPNSMSAFGDAGPSFNVPSTPHEAEQPFFGEQQQVHTASTRKPAHQQVILDDLDTSFENLLSALRAMDSAYLLSIGQGA